MITQLVLKGFKSWARIENMRLAQITGLFGANSSGKTSVLQFLLMLKQTVESRDRSQVLNLGGEERDLVNLGSFSHLIHGCINEGNLGLELAWKLPDTLSFEVNQQQAKRALSGDEMSFFAEVSQTLIYPHRVKQMGYRFAGRKFSSALVNPDGPEYSLSTDVDGFKFMRRGGGPRLISVESKCYLFPDEARECYENAGFLSAFELQFERLFSRVYYLGPLRASPRRVYDWSRTVRGDVGLSGENAVFALLATEQREPSLRLQELTAHWLKKLGMVHSFRVAPYAEGSQVYKVLIRTTPGAPEVLLPDVGFGVSQILPVLVLCYSVPRGSIIILEQPEIHLHPAVQAALADVFIDAAKRRNIQIIFESHSEHLLRRFLRRIAEGPDSAEGFDPQNTAMYFCKMAGGESNLSPLQINDFGRVSNWPDDFFGDEFGEIAAMEKAALKREISRGQPQDGA